MNPTTEGSSLRQTRHLAFIAEFTTDIRYVKGETNFVADALSRLTVSAIECDAIINFKDLSADQALETEFIRLRHSTSSTMEFQLLKTFDDVLAWCDVSTGHNRPYVPENEYRCCELVQIYSGSQSHTTRRGRASCSLWYAPVANVCDLLLYLDENRVIPEFRHF